MLKDFKNFVMRGNILDLAVAVIIGAAFGKIVTSFVGDVLMPPIGMLLGDVNFTELFLVLGDAGTFDNLAAAREAGAPVIGYGAFIQTIIDFIIIAFAIFMVIKAYEKTKKQEEAAPAAPPAPSNEEKLLAEIRDLLKK